MTGPTYLIGSWILVVKLNLMNELSEDEDASTRRELVKRLAI